MCQIRKAYAESRQEQLQKIGWYANAVFPDRSAPNSYNVYTHGIAENFSHPDFQICFPLPVPIIMKLFAVLVDAVKKGNRFRPGVFYPGILHDELDLQFIEARESGRNVLRLIIPDENNQYEGDVYKNQFQLRDEPPAVHVQDTAGSFTNSLVHRFFN